MNSLISENIVRIFCGPRLSRPEHRRMVGLLRDDVVRSTACSSGIKHSGNTRCLGITFYERVLFYVVHSKQHVCFICKTTYFSISKYSCVLRRVDCKNLTNISKRHIAAIFRIKCAMKSDVILLTSVNLLKTERRPLYLKAQSVPRCKRFSSRL
jgi:hypothetical protein